MGLSDAVSFYFFFFQAEDGIRDVAVTGVQTCALPILGRIATGTALVALAFAFAAATAIFNATYNAQLLVDAQLTNGADVTVTGSTATRSEERRVGKECTTGWSPYESNKNGQRTRRDSV